MDNYKKRQQKKHGSDFKPTSRADEGRRTKMRMERETTDSSNKESSGKISNSTSSSLHKRPQHNGRGEGSRGQSPRPGFDPRTNGLYETSTKGPSLPPQPGFDPETNYELYKTSGRGSSLPPRPSANEKKVVNWRLACFMCNEYLTRGTLLGRPWPPQDSKPNCHESDEKLQPKSGCLDQDGDECRREKERLYHTITDFLKEGDVHLPGIVNPSQVAAWLGL